MRAEDTQVIARALGSAVTGTRTLAGGFSHETSLLELADSRRVVARIGGGNPAVEAAVMEAARAHVPVPRVLAILPELPAMVLEHVDGTLLSDVLSRSAAGDGADAGDMAALGATVGQAFGAIGAVTFKQPGFFTGPDLTTAAMPPWSEQLPAMTATWMDQTPDSRLAPAERQAWVELCARHAPSLAAVDTDSRLVHADANPKNVLVSPVEDGWRVDAVLDWEFSFSGCPYADYANMTRFGDAYPHAFVTGFRAGFESCQEDPRHAWAYRGRLLDMFALSDLVTRPEGNPVADQAAAVIRRWLADGVPAE